MACFDVRARGWIAIEESVDLLPVIDQADQTLIVEDLEWILRKLVE